MQALHSASGWVLQCADGAGSWPCGLAAERRRVFFAYRVDARLAVNGQK